jgi:chaperone modulatory protein CbpM
MISIDAVMEQIAGLPRQDLERWIARHWVKPEHRAGVYLFEEIDVARVHLIWELREDVGVDEDILPIVLSLLDQLYEQRRRFHALSDAIRRTASDDMRAALARHLIG